MFSGILRIVLHIKCIRKELYTFTAKHHVGSAPPHLRNGSKWSGSKCTKGYYEILSGILHTVSHIKFIHKELYTFATEHHVGSAPLHRNSNGKLPYSKYGLFESMRLRSAPSIWIASQAGAT